jgi:hypothetical protein
VTIDDARKVLAEAAKLRIPRRSDEAIKEGGTRVLVEKLEEYLLETAYWRGELEEARLHMYDARQLLVQQWSELQGYEAALPSGAARNPTRDQVIAAKRQMRPDLYSGMEEAKYLIDRLSDQIRRLKDDDAATSRAYTLATGS